MLQSNKQCFSDDVLPTVQASARGRHRGVRDLLHGPDGVSVGQGQPERWLNENGEFQPESPFEFTAFQAGPRMCQGKEFAYRAPPFRLRDGENASVKPSTTAPCSRSTPKVCIRRRRRGEFAGT
jgi:hypothetical protein